ncbi:MAG TPA: class I SAM-dependent methyltransferase [Candidatus Acidoferrales bacterium]|nr:class I SAM-dependent methyltransferase [Candidatus Acidoferrales bacterium]
MTTGQAPARDRTVLAAEVTGGLGELEFHHPPGTFVLTPASRISLEAIAGNQKLLAGVGIDWGSGVGCLAIAAARIPAVARVTGLEISPANVSVARENARRNGVEPKISFLLSDSFSPLSEDGRYQLRALRGGVDFLLANPPSSDGDDGFEFRRIVLRGARQFLKPGAGVFLSVSFQYGERRWARLEREIPGFRCERVLASTDWAPFDLARPDLLRCLRDYAAEERRGGHAYVFPDGPPAGDAWMSAEVALARFERTGESPLTKWQTLLYRFQR